MRGLDYTKIQLFEFYKYFLVMPSPPQQQLRQTLVAVDKGRRSVADSLLRRE